MNIPAQIKQRVERKLRQGIEVIEKHYKCKLNMPKISYKLGGVTAGRAYADQWMVKFNPVLLNENSDDFIARTVPHELAHLACHKIYPEAYNLGADDEAEGMFRMLRAMGRGRRLRRPKRDIHGYRWQEIMRVLGVADITRCHSYDVTNSARKKAGSHEYRCTGCSKTLTLGAKRHAREQRKPGTFWHGGCGRARLELVTNAAPTPVAKITAPKTPEAGTKLAQAYALYKAWQHRYNRQEMIAVFRNEIGMTTAGASTYVYQCQRLYNAGVL